MHDLKRIKIEYNLESLEVMSEELKEKISTMKTMRNEMQNEHLKAKKIFEKCSFFEKSAKDLMDILLSHVSDIQQSCDAPKRKKAEYKNTRYENKTRPARKSALLNSIINKIKI